MTAPGVEWQPEFPADPSADWLDFGCKPGIVGLAKGCSPAFHVTSSQKEAAKSRAMPVTASTTIDPSVRHQELALARRMNGIAEQYAEYWLEHGPDREFGGFHGFLDRRGQPAEPTIKWLTQQSRHLWTFSTWYERREKSSRIESVARSLYQFITEHFGNERGDGFYRQVNRAGQVVDPVHQVYPEAFAVYALSTFGRVFAEPKAIERALACFKAFDRRVYEPRFGGYDLTNEPPWQTPGASKETNTHIHVMEALTALAEVSQDPDVQRRLREFAELTITRHRQPLNYAHLEFLLDYTPFGATARELWPRFGDVLARARSASRSHRLCLG